LFGYLPVKHLFFHGISHDQSINNCKVRLLINSIKSIYKFFVSGHICKFCKLPVHHGKDSRRHQK
jgi:hypothetical protein